MKEYFSELNDVLNAYTFGDLFEAMQAVELCDQLITEEKIPEQELLQIRNLKSILESIILQGSSDEKEQALLQIKTNLAEGKEEDISMNWSSSAVPEKTEKPSVTADDLLMKMGAVEESSDDSGSFGDLLSKMTDTADAEREQADIDTLLSQMKEESDNTKLTDRQVSTENDQPQTVTIAVDDGETLNSFVSESMEHLDSVETLIINLEETHDHDTVNAIFRAMHTIKGVSGFMGFSQITQLSHKLENLLDALRSNEIVFSAELIDILLAGSDMLRAMMNVLAPIAAEYAASEDSFNVEFPVYNIDPILNDVDKYMSSHSASDSGSSEQTTSGNNLSDKKSIQEPQPAASTEIPASSFSAPQLTPSELGEYAYAAKKIFQNLKQSLLKLQEDIHNQTALNEILTETDTLNKASSKLGIQEISDLCGLISNKIKRAEGGYALSYSDLFSGLKTLADAFKARMILLKQTVGIAVSPDENEKNPSDETSAPLPDVSADIESARKPSEDKIPASAENRSIPTPVPSPSPVGKEADSKPSHTVAAGQSPAADPEATTVRVDVKKMDKLFNMIGELITAQDILLEQFRTDEESQEIQKAKSHLEKVTREIQELSMQLRMVTLNALFNKMKRVARDLSRKLNKEVNFNIFGQDTEMDRNVIDEISDPLMHIIRNALDHGIEDAATRQAAGKSPIGNVTLGAEYEGNGIVISVRDDGGGLNKEKILAKAIQNGIVSEEAAASMPERKIFDLVMLPGFSTSEKVSDISGRGVGMDVVKRSIDALRGSINILSEEGKGSEFRIRIPLTLAIIDAIAFKIGNLTFATQITDVVEFYKAKQEQITTTQSQGQVLNLRGELIPILEMSSYFNLEHKYVSYEDGIVIVASSNNKKVAIVVDEIIGNKHLVIKPLPTVFAHISSLSGCSILAGGDTCLIVDMNRLLGEILDLT